MAISAPHATPWETDGCARRAPAAMLATAVPWEKPSAPVSSTASGVNSSVTVFPANIGWSRIDAGVDEADGHPGTGLGVIALEQAEVGVGYVRP